MAFNFFNIGADWQRLVLVLLFVLANCLFLFLLLRATRPRPSTAGVFANDQIAESLPAVGQAPILQTLDQLRSFIRSALFATHATPASEKEIRSPILASILSLELDRTALPDRAPKDAPQLLEAIIARIAELRLLVETGAPGSDISGLLIALNADARTLSTMLAASQPCQTLSA